VITIGSRVGGYTIVQKLGQGGMGQVFLAQHYRIARRAAVKVLLPELSANQEVVERFFTEARATSLIRHPAIVEVLDCDVQDGQAYIVMEALDGESLADYLYRTGGLENDVPFALAVVGQVALAVSAAHARGIVHRDLKPDNLFLSMVGDHQRPVVKVLDFGIAKLMERGVSTHTRTGALLGTPPYMSPEQCRGGSREIDGRSDIYSLGCILYEALSGRPPFVRDGTGDLLIAHVSETPENLRVAAPTAPALVAALVARMLAKSPSDRPSRMDLIAQELATCLASLGISSAFSEIAPRSPVILKTVPQESPAPRQVAPTTPLQTGSAESASSPGPVSGGTRLLPNIGAPGGASASASNVSTTFGNTVGERWTAPSIKARRKTIGRVAIALAAVGGAIAFVALRGQTLGPRAEDQLRRSPAGSASPADLRPPVTPGADDRVTIDLRGTPPGAEVFLDGERRVDQPLRIPRADRRHHLLVQAPGHDELSLDIDARRDRVVDLDMAPAPDKAASGPKDEPVSRGTHHRDRLNAKPRPPAPREPSSAAKPPPTPPPRSAYDDM
jgi:serine/threonine protein kinase